MAFNIKGMMLLVLDNVLPSESPDDWNPREHGGYVLNNGRLCLIFQSLGVGHTAGHVFVDYDADDGDGGQRSQEFRVDEANLGFK